MPRPGNHGKQGSGPRATSAARLAAMDIDELGRLFHAGNLQAWGELHTRLAGAMAGFAMRDLSAAFDDAEDLVQRAFTRAWENRGRFDPERTFSTWVIQIMRNLHYGDRRGVARQRELTLSSAEDGPAGLWYGSYLEEPDTYAERRALQRRMTEAFGVLGEADQEALEPYLQGVSIGEYARTQGDKASTARGRAMRARQRFKEAWASVDAA